MNEKNSNYNSHVWAYEWPGNFCLKCGLDDPIENMGILVNCDKCDGKGCEECCWSGCRVQPQYIPPCS